MVRIRDCLGANVSTHQRAQRANSEGSGVSKYTGQQRIAATSIVISFRGYEVRLPQYIDESGITYGGALSANCAVARNVDNIQAPIR